MDVKVKVLEIDPRGKVRLSMRVVDQETGAELEDTRPPREERPRGDRPDRGPRRDGEGRGDRGPRRDGGGDRGPRREGGGARDEGRGPRPEGGGDRGPRSGGGGGYGGGRDRDSAPKDNNDDGPAPEFAPAFLTRED